jgi:hypothetical protein
VPVWSVTARSYVANTRNALQKLVVKIRYMRNKPWHNGQRLPHLHARSHTLPLSDVFWSLAIATPLCSMRMRATPRSRNGRRSIHRSFADGRCITHGANGHDAEVQAYNAASGLPNSGIQDCPRATPCPFPWHAPRTLSGAARARRSAVLRTLDGRREPVQHGHDGRRADGTGRKRTPASYRRHRNARRTLLVAYGALCARWRVSMRASDTWCGCHSPPDHVSKRLSWAGTMGGSQSRSMMRWA